MSAVLHPHRRDVVDLDDELRALFGQPSDDLPRDLPDDDSATARVVAFPTSTGPGQARVRARRAGSRGARYVRPPHRATWALTRRGELVVHWSVAVVTLAVAVLVVTAGGFAIARAVDGGSPTTQVVLVEPGQSIWSIATATDPEADPGETAATIQRLNGLDGGSVVPGQRLVVPVSR